MLERSLRLLFDAAGDPATTSDYVCAEFRRLLEGRAPLDEFIFAKQYRGLHAYSASARVPALKIAR